MARSISPGHRPSKRGTRRRANSGRPDTPQGRTPSSNGGYSVPIPIRLGMEGLEVSHPWSFRSAGGQAGISPLERDHDLPDEPEVEGAARDHEQVEQVVGAED